MKTIIIMFIAVMTHSFVSADSLAKKDKKLLELFQAALDLEPLTTKESSTVRGAIKSAIKEIKDTNSLSPMNRDLVSSAVIHHFILLKSIKCDKESIGIILRNVYLELNRRVADGLIHEMVASQKEVDVAIELAVDLKNHSNDRGVEAFADLPRASTLAFFALISDESEMLLSTHDIHTLWKVANYLEGAGWKRHSQALQLAAAKATKKLKIYDVGEVKDDPFSSFFSNK